MLPDSRKNEGWNHLKYKILKHLFLGRALAYCLWQWKKTRCEKTSKLTVVKILSQKLVTMHFKMIPICHQKSVHDESLGAVICLSLTYKPRKHWGLALTCHMGRGPIIVSFSIEFFCYFLLQLLVEIHPCDATSHLGVSTISYAARLFRVSFETRF